MTAFQFILAALACYRLTVLFSRDAGPFKIFSKLRTLKHGIGPLFGCPFCVSIHLGLAIVISFNLSGVKDSFVVSACVVLALSAISIALDRVFTSDHQA